MISNKNQIEFDLLKEVLYQHNIKLNEIKEMNNKIEPLFEIEEYDSEIATTFEYSDKIALINFHVKKDNKNIIPGSSGNDNTEIVQASPSLPPMHTHTNTNVAVKLSMLNL